MMEYAADKAAAVQRAIDVLQGQVDVLGGKANETGEQYWYDRIAEVIADQAALEIIKTELLEGITNEDTI